MVGRHLESNNNQLESNYKKLYLCFGNNNNNNKNAINNHNGVESKKNKKETYTRGYSCNKLNKVSLTVGWTSQLHWMVLTGWAAWCGKVKKLLFESDRTVTFVQQRASSNILQDPEIVEGLSECKSK